MPELARPIALRRTPMEDAEAGIAGFAETHDPAALTAMLEQLAKPETSIDGLAVATKRLFAKDTLAQLVVVQPAPIDTR